jgi:hypothetical protein
MKLDIEPTIEKATGLNKIKMQMMEIDALYVVRLANGDEYTVTWDRKGLEEFQPKANISDVMKSWEESILRTIKTNKKAAETRKHPTWKTHFEDENGKLHEKAYPLSDVSVDNFKMFVERDLKKVGKMELVKFV